MSHDVQAAYASAELARRFSESPDHCFAEHVDPATVSSYATREGESSWPIADGVVHLDRTPDASYDVGVEFKRTNEGIHGVLTALGQAHAYLHKGFAGSAIVIPRSYDSHPRPGEYLRDVIGRTSPNEPIGVFVYAEPDLELARPFEDRLECVRGLNIALQPGAQAGPRISAAGTQWAHLREGSTEPDAFAKYMAVAKQLPMNAPEPTPQLPAGLQAVVTTNWPNQDAVKVLASAPGNTFHDKVWRHFWFKHVLIPDVATIWQPGGAVPYQVNDAETALVQWDDTPKRFFSGRRDSVKETVVAQLNAGAIDEAEAWRAFAENVRSRAHSYREDLDSGLAHIGFLEADGRPSELGYRFVDACERSGSSVSALPLAILRSALLRHGDMLAFLHYVHRLSEETFHNDPQAFSARRRHGSGFRVEFDASAYLEDLRQKLASELKVMRTSERRGGTERKPFQGELAILRHLGLVGGLRTGLGLEIRWPTISEALDFEL